MKNKTAFIGLSLSTLLFFAIIGLEIFINGRPKTFDYCNGGDYPYSNWLYEYGNFAWQNVPWSKIFGSAKIYLELFLLTPYFIFFSSKINGETNVVHTSKWLKAIMWIGVVPLILLFFILNMQSQPLVIDYDTDSDPVARNILYTFAFTLLGNNINMLIWIITNISSIKKINTKG